MNGEKGDQKQPTPTAVAAAANRLFDGKLVAATLDDIAAKLPILSEGESAFVTKILTRIPATPPNYLKIVELNETGVFPDGDPNDLEAGANRCAVS
jgi:hypothetical protein